MQSDGMVDKATGKVSSNIDVCEQYCHFWDRNSQYCSARLSRLPASTSFGLPSLPTCVSRRVSACLGVCLCAGVCPLPACLPPLLWLAPPWLEALVRCDVGTGVYECSFAHVSHQKIVESAVSHDPAPHTEGVPSPPIAGPRCSRAGVRAGVGAAVVMETRLQTAVTLASVRTPPA
eukprot:SAG11_NODE_1105_length_5858_cov_3.050009_10_plen_175_part_01